MRKKYYDDAKENAELREELEYYRNRKLSGRQKHNAKWMARDVVKKTAYGVDFVIWGIENQQRIHYAMPLRHMIEDALSYLKEYNEIAKKNKKEKASTTKDEFLSRFKKTDCLHPVITLCIYYGESEWDGASSLKGMLEIPDYLEKLVSDYKMNLIQVRNSEGLHFKNKDVQTIFELSRLIYQKKIWQNYKYLQEQGNNK